MTLGGQLQTCLVTQTESWAVETLTLVNNSLRLGIKDMALALDALMMKGMAVEDRDLVAFFAYWKVFRLTYKAQLDVIQDSYLPLLQSKTALTQSFRDGEDNQLACYDKMKDFCLFEKQIGEVETAELVKMVTQQYAPMGNMILDYIKFQEAELAPAMLASFSESDKKIFVSCMLERIGGDSYGEEITAMFVSWMPREQRQKFIKKYLPIQTRMKYDLSWRSQYEKKYVKPLHSLFSA